MARDIEEFLRKAAERRKQAQQGGGQPAAPQRPAQPAPVPQQRPVAPPPAQRQPYSPPPTTPSRQPPQRQPVEAEVVWSNRESVAAHVQAHISTRSIAEHASQLGQEVGLADDKLEQRLHEKFDHSVGTLGHLDTTGEGATSGDDLLQLLRNPQSLRQAILLSEILKRPEF